MRFGGTGLDVVFSGEVRETDGVDEVEDITAAIEGY